MNIVYLLQAEAVLLRATADATKKSQQFEEKSNSFERQKLQDIKGALLSFIQIEMSYYAKALQLFTDAYKQIDAIEDEDRESKNFENRATVINKKSKIAKNPRKTKSLSTLFTRKLENNNPTVSTRRSASSQQVIHKVNKQENSQSEQTISDEDMSDDDSQSTSFNLGNKNH